jgi:hypothetical protein
VIKELIKLANELDEIGLTREADALDHLVKMAEDAACAQRAAAAMVVLTDHVRDASEDPCQRTSYPFDADISIKRDIVDALTHMRKADKDVDTILADYLQDSRHSFEFLKEMSIAGGFIGSVIQQMGRQVAGSGAILGDATEKLKTHLIDKPKAQRALSYGGSKVDRQGNEI